METPKPLPLYAIDAELAELERALIEAEGEITEDVNERFDDLLQMREDKVGGYVAVIRRLETSAEAYGGEAKRLTANARQAIGGYANHAEQRRPSQATSPRRHDQPGRHRV